MKRNVKMCLLLLAAAGGANARARAQSISYLLPDRYEVVAGREVALHVARGTSGALATIPWPGEGIEWFFVRTAGTQRNVAKPATALPGEDSLRLELKEPDVALIGMDSRPWIETVRGTDLRRFLESELAASALPADWMAQTSGETLRVRRVESAKLLVRVVNSAPGSKEAWRGSATAPSKSGQRTEIRPLIDPTAMALGSDLPLRISWADSGSVDVRIVTRQVATGTTQTTLAPAGAGWFTVSAPGEWRVEVHRAKKLKDDPAADWELETATLSFLVPAASKPAGGGK
jgi:hypothetical protein